MIENGQTLASFEITLMRFNGVEFISLPSSCAQPSCQYN